MENISNLRRFFSPQVRSLMGFAVLVGLFILFYSSGLREEVSMDRLRELGANPYTPILIILAMTAAWTFGLPASAFFFITPLLFTPLEATAIVCAGSAAGTTTSYLVARYIGGPWVERFRDHRITKFLERHSTFASLFAIRIFPGSWHSVINYGAGLVKIPMGKFVAATLCAVAIKAFLYASAIEGSVGAANIREALNWQTVTALSALGVLAIGGHIMTKRYERSKEGIQEAETMR